MAAKSTLFILVNLLSLAGVLYVNYLAVALPMAGRTPADVSGMYPTLFTPAGFTFGIWGIIYTADRFLFIPADLPGETHA